MDIANHFYCYSFEPSDHWTEFFAQQPELQAYFQRVFLDQPHSLQVVAPGRWGVLPEGAGQVLESAEAIKSGHETYRIE